MKTTNKSKKIRIMKIVLIILIAVLAALAVIAIVRRIIYQNQLKLQENIYDDYIPQYYNVKSYDSVSSFITSMKEEGTKKTPDYFDTENEPSDGDKIVVLSTCIGGQDDRRLLVVGKLVDTVMYSSGSMTN